MKEPRDREGLLSNGRERGESLCSLWKLCCFNTAGKDGEPGVARGDWLQMDKEGGGEGRGGGVRGGWRQLLLAVEYTVYRIWGPPETWDN